MLDYLKKAFHYISTVFLYSVFVVMILVVLAVCAYFVDQKFAGNSNEYRAPLFSAYVIISESMVPNINVHDAVVTMRKKPESIKIDDVITFSSEDSRSTGVTITHRVVGIVKTEKGLAYRTKGDNNNVEDSTLVNYDHIIGKVLFKIPFIGRIQSLLTSASGWVILIVLPCVGIILYDLYKLLLVALRKKNGVDGITSDKSTKDAIPVKSDESLSSYSNSILEINSEELIDDSNTTVVQDNVTESIEEIEQIDSNGPSENFEELEAIDTVEQLEDPNSKLISQESDSIESLEDGVVEELELLDDDSFIQEQESEKKDD